MSNYFFVADTHFHHRNIIKYSQRPFTNVWDMNEHIIENWNKRVNEDDYVIHAGDFCFGNTSQMKDVVNRLNGKIILIRGNHDYDMSYTKLKERMGFYEIYDYFALINRTYFVTHRPRPEQILNEYERTAFGLEGGFEYKWQVNIHGHTHANKSKYAERRTHNCVSVDRTNFKPVTLKELGHNNPSNIHIRGVGRMNL